MSSLWASWLMEVLSMDLKSKFRHVMDFPKEGIDFIDITTVLNDGDAFKYAIDEMAKRVIIASLDVVVIIGTESRGFIFGAALEAQMGLGFVPARKAGKLPGEVVSGTYQLEYGSDTLEMHKDSICKGNKVVIIDDLLATGGTVGCVADMVELMGGKVVDCLFVTELSKLNGRKKLESKGLVVDSLVDFDDIY